VSKKTISISKQSTCDICKGTGGKVGTKMNTCTTCAGHGKVEEVRRSILGSFSTTKICDVCMGNGKIPAEKCSICHGAGVLRKQKDLDVNIPEGINKGEMLKMTGMGEAIKSGKTGDLYIKVNASSHPLYRREGNNLIMDLSIKLTDAVLGMTYRLTTLEGNTVEVKIPEGINNGEMLRVRGKGVPTSGGRGDIIIHMEVEIPSKISKKVKEIMERLKEEGF
jgi:molecular chaperone DnaJ